MKIAAIGVIGAGTMGSGIAQVLAQAGYDTTIVDTKQEFIDRGIATIQKSLSRFVKKGTITQESADEIISRIHTSIDLRNAVKDLDYIIEAAFERADIKLSIMNQLDEVCREDVILASNTSGVPISLLSSVTKRPDKVIGMHFMNPVPVMKGIEVVKSLLTSNETLDISLELAKSVGKEPVVVKDSPGFVTNRILPVLLNEGAKLLEEGLATVEDIDKIIKLSFNWPMGPFELADLVGIDVIVDLAEGVYQQTGWERFKPTPILKRMVEIGYIGRKANKGFYTLSGEK